jgi:uncharacterized protein
MSRNLPLQVVLRTIPPEGLVLRGEVELASLLDMPADERLSFPHPLELELRVLAVHGGVVVRGWLRTRLCCQCDRCLGRYEMPVDVSNVCYAYEKPKAETIDLTPEVREDILLAFPQRLLCRDDCRGLCSTCGRDLNQGDCACHGSRQESGPWAALDQIRLTSPGPHPPVPAVAEHGDDEGRVQETGKNGPPTK